MTLLHRLRRPAVLAAVGALLAPLVVGAGAGTAAAEPGDPLLAVGSFAVTEGGSPAAGVPVALLDGDDAVVAETVTGESGGYRFDGLDPGTYRVEVRVPDALSGRWELTTPGAGDAATGSDVVPGTALVGRTAPFALAPGDPEQVVALLAGDPSGTRPTRTTPTRPGTPGCASGRCPWATACGPTPTATRSPTCTAPRSARSAPGRTGSTRSRTCCPARTPCGWTRRRRRPCSRRTSPRRPVPATTRRSTRPGPGRAPTGRCPAGRTTPCSTSASARCSRSATGSGSTRTATACRTSGSRVCPAPPSAWSVPVAARRSRRPSRAPTASGGSTG